MKKMNEKFETAINPIELSSPKETCEYGTRSYVFL